jgi:hypothetical protein
MQALLIYTSKCNNLNILRYVLFILRLRGGSTQKLIEKWKKIFVLKQRFRPLFSYCRLIYVYFLNEFSVFLRSFYQPHVYFSFVAMETEEHFFKVLTAPSLKIYCFVQNWEETTSKACWLCAQRFSTQKLHYGTRKHASRARSLMPVDFRRNFPSLVSFSMRNCWLNGWKTKRSVYRKSNESLALVENENTSVKWQNLHQLLVKMSAMLGTLILYNCLLNNDESAGDSGEISTPTSASRTKLRQHMVLKSVPKAKE